MPNLRTGLHAEKSHRAVHDVRRGGLALLAGERREGETSRISLHTGQDGAGTVIRLLVLVSTFILAIGNLPAAVTGPPTKTLWYEVDAEGEITLDLYFFWKPTCPRCRKAKPFVEDLPQEYPWLRLRSFDLRNNRRNVARYISMARRVGGDANSVPGFIFCGHMLTGFDSSKGMGKALRESLLNCREAVRQNLVKSASEGANGFTGQGPSIGQD